MFKESDLNEQTKAKDSAMMPQNETEAKEQAGTVCIDNVFFIENGTLKQYSGNQREIIIPEGVTRINDSLFYENVTIRKVYIPDSVSYMGWQTFEECHNLREVRLSEKLDDITPNSFFHTALEQIDIPSSVRSISRRAFADCKNLVKVIINSKKINIDASAFKGSNNVIIYCQEHLIEDLHRITRLPCMPLSSISAELDTDRVSYFDNIKLMKAFPDADPVEKAKSYTINIGSKEFKVRIKAENCIEEFEDSDPFYTFTETQGNYISLEESRQEILDSDPNMRTDAYIYDARPRIDKKNARQMEEDDYLIRFDFLKKVYRSLNNIEILQLIAEETPKKKNGTFNMKSYLSIACAGIVNYDCSIPEIIAKPKNDTSLEIFVKDILFTPEEVRKIKDDFFVRHFLQVNKTEEAQESGVVSSDQVDPKVCDTSEISISLTDIPIPVTVIKTEEGDYAIDANPVRSLKRFDFLVGNATDGFEIALPDCKTTVNSEGIQVEVFLDKEAFIDAWNEIKAVSQYYQAPDKNADAFQNVMDVVDYRGMDWTQEKLAHITESNEFISRYVYVFLRSIEHIETHYEEYARESADTAPRKKDGNLWPGKQTQFSGFLMEEMGLDNFGFSSFINSYSEKDNKIRMLYEGTIEI